MLGRPLLFMSSYAPLFALLAIRFEPPWLWIPCTVLAGGGVAALWLLLKLDARSAPGPHVLTSVRDAGADPLVALRKSLRSARWSRRLHPREAEHASA